MSKAEVGEQVTMRTVPDLMRRLRTGVAKGLMSVTTSGDIGGKNHDKYLGMTPRVESNRSGVTILCEFPNGTRIPIPVTSAKFRPRRKGECVAFYRLTKEGIMVTYVMANEQRGQRHFQFGVSA